MFRRLLPAAMVCSLIGTPLFAETLTFKATDNAHVCNIGKEKYMSAGKGATRGKLKGPEEFVLVNFDLSKLKGKTITKATLRFGNAGASLIKVGFSTIATPWTGGPSSRLGKHDDGSATWAASASPDKPWAWKGSTLAHVSNGLGSSRSCYGQVKSTRGWFELNVDPRIVEAVASGDQHGFLISEHDGWRRTPWVKECIGKQPDSVHNPRIFMKEQHGKGAVLTVTTSPAKDTTAPGPLKARSLSNDSLQVGEVMIEVTATGDDGAKGKALYYEVKADGKRMPAWMLQEPDLAGRLQRIRLSNLEPGKKSTLTVVAVDEGGNRSPMVQVTAPVTARPTLPSATPCYSLDNGGPVSNGTLAAWAYPDLCQINPVTGNLLEEGGYGKVKGGQYRNGNNVWDGKKKHVQLRALRDEWIAFQVGIENLSGKPLKDIKITWSGDSSLKCKIYRQWFVKFNNSFYPDALVPLHYTQDTIAIPAADNAVSGQTVQPVYADILVDKDARPGRAKGLISITAPGANTLEIPVEIEICTAQLSRKINYTVEFNHYSGWQNHFKGASVGPNLANSRFINLYNAHAALAHQHRCTFNGVPYTHNGTSRRPIPQISGQGSGTRITDWTVYDKLYSGVLSGQAFAGNHRPEQPMTHLTLPFYEGWPASINTPGMFEHNRKNNPSLDPRFTKKFEDQVKAVAKQFIAHFKTKGWTKTQLQLFLNNKSQYRKRGGKGGICYWLLDEPRYHNGYLALNYLGTLFRNAFQDRGAIDIAFRADISRPQFQDRILDRSMDLMVIGGPAEGEVVVRRNADRFDGNPFRKGAQLVWDYGGLAPQSGSNVQYATGRVFSYLLGSNGHLPWLCTGKKDDWRQQDKNSFTLMYNGESQYAPVKKVDLFPSLRLKAFRRGQQDAEIIHAALSKKKLTRDQFRQAIRSVAWYAGKTYRNWGEDAGVTKVGVDLERHTAAVSIARNLLGGPLPFASKQAKPPLVAGAPIGKLTFQKNGSTK